MHLLQLARQVVQVRVTFGALAVQGGHRRQLLRFEFARGRVIAQGGGGGQRLLSERIAQLGDAEAYLAIHRIDVFFKEGIRRQHKPPHAIFDQLVGLGLPTGHNLELVAEFIHKQRAELFPLGPLL